MRVGGENRILAQLSKLVVEPVLNHEVTDRFSFYKKHSHMDFPDQSGNVW